jgi:parallel beta-helix repeat protein
MKRVIFGLMMTLLAIGVLSCAFNIKPAKGAWTGTVYIRADGSMDPPDAPIITYDNLTYTLTENITSSGNGIIVERDNIILDGAGYTIQGVGFEWGGIGTQLIERNNVTIKNVNIKDIFIGIDLYKSSNNSLTRNNIIDTGEGVFLHGTYENQSRYNTIFGNNIAHSHAEGIRFECSSENTINHNNFVDNRLHVYFFVSTNFWDDGYPSGGNYWSNYTGVDLYSGPYQNETGCDGVGDVSYVIDANNRDNYPLMGPSNTFGAQHWDGLTYNFDVVSNSTILNFELFESLIPEIPSKISLNVSGPDNARGFCRITIPNTIVQELWQGNYTVLLNGEPWPFTNWTGTVNTYIYIDYTHSEHEIIIIPEFPSTITLALFMLTTLFATALLKTKRKRQAP